MGKAVAMPDVGESGRWLAALLAALGALAGFFRHMSPKRRRDREEGERRGGNGRRRLDERVTVIEKSLEFIQEDIREIKQTQQRIFKRLDNLVDSRFRGGA